MSDTEYPHCGCADFWPGQGHHPDCPVRHKFETLERENAAMREAIRDAHDALILFKRAGFRMNTDYDLQGSGLIKSTSALSKLQPFLKP